LGNLNLEFRDCLEFSVSDLEFTGPLYSYVIDFNKVENGSDLWLFAKTTNLENEGMVNLSVLLTPNFDGKVWYEKDKKNLALTIYAAPITNYQLPITNLDVLS